jgi:hypothetical protein
MYRALTALFVLFVAVADCRAGEAQAEHDKAYWQAVVANGFTPAEDAQMPSLVRELSGYLGSPDPELRDAIAYSVLTQWIYVKQAVPVDLLRGLSTEWTANLSRGVGENGTDSVFLRSFSALMLSVAVALDNEAPWLDGGSFDRLLLATLAYLREEQDTRGFDAGKGWIHSVAHTADLLKFLGRSRYLDPEDQAAILNAIAEKLAQLDHVLVHGEDERLARAVISILARPDMNATAFDAFLEQLKPVRLPGLPKPADIAANQNSRHLAVSLYALLATDQRALGTLQQAAVKLRAWLAAASP